MTSLCIIYCQNLNMTPSLSDITKTNTSVFIYMTTAMCFIILAAILNMIHFTPKPGKKYDKKNIIMKVFSIIFFVCGAIVLVSQLIQKLNENEKINLAYLNVTKFNKDFYISKSDKLISLEKTINDYVLLTIGIISLLLGLVCSKITYDVLKNDHKDKDVSKAKMAFKSFLFIFLDLVLFTVGCTLIILFLVSGKIIEIKSISDKEKPVEQIDIFDSQKNTTPEQNSLLKKQSVQTEETNTLLAHEMDLNNTKNSEEDSLVSMKIKSSNYIKEEFDNYNTTYDLINIGTQIQNIISKFDNAKFFTDSINKINKVNKDFLKVQNVINDFKTNSGLSSFGLDQLKSLFNLLNNLELNKTPESTINKFFIENNIEFQNLENLLLIFGFTNLKDFKQFLINNKITVKSLVDLSLFIDNLNDQTYENYKSKITNIFKKIENDENLTDDQILILNNKLITSLSDNFDTKLRLTIDTLIEENNIFYNIQTNLNTMFGFSDIEGIQQFFTNNNIQNVEGFNLFLQNYLVSKTAQQRVLSTYSTALDSTNINDFNTNLSTVFSILNNNNIDISNKNNLQNTLNDKKNIVLPIVENINLMKKTTAASDLNQLQIEVNSFFNILSNLSITQYNAQAMAIGVNNYANGKQKVLQALNAISSIFGTSYTLDQLLNQITIFQDLLISNGIDITSLNLVDQCSQIVINENNINILNNCLIKLQTDPSNIISILNEFKSSLQNNNLKFENLNDQLSILNNQKAQFLTKRQLIQNIFGNSITEKELSLFLQSLTNDQIIFLANLQSKVQSTNIVQLINSKMINDLKGISMGDLITAIAILDDIPANSLDMKKINIDVKSAIQAIQEKLPNDSLNNLQKIFNILQNQSTDFMTLLNDNLISVIQMTQINEIILLLNNLGINSDTNSVFNNINQLNTSLLNLNLDVSNPNFSSQLTDLSNGYSSSIMNTTKNFLINKNINNLDLNSVLSFLNNYNGDLLTDITNLRNDQIFIENSLASFGISDLLTNKTTNEKVSIIKSFYENKDLILTLDLSQKLGINNMSDLIAYFTIINRIPTFQIDNSITLSDFLISSNQNINSIKIMSILSNFIEFKSTIIKNTSDVTTLVTEMNNQNSTQSWQDFLLNNKNFTYVQNFCSNLADNIKNAQIINDIPSSFSENINLNDLILLAIYKNILQINKTHKEDISQVYNDLKNITNSSNLTSIFDEFSNSMIKMKLYIFLTGFLIDLKNNRNTNLLNLNPSVINYNPSTELSFPNSIKINDLAVNYINNNNGVFTTSSLYGNLQTSFVDSCTLNPDNSVLFSNNNYGGISISGISPGSITILSNKFLIEEINNSNANIFFIGNQYNSFVKSGNNYGLGLKKNSSQNQFVYFMFNDYTQISAANLVNDNLELVNSISKIYFNGFTEVYLTSSKVGSANVFLVKVENNCFYINVSNPIGILEFINGQFVFNNSIIPPLFPGSNIYLAS